MLWCLNKNRETYKLNFLEQAVLFQLMARSIFYDTQLRCRCSPSHWPGGPNDNNHGVTRHDTVVPDIVSGTDVPGHEDGRGPDIPVLDGVRIIFWWDNLVYFLTCHFGKSENHWFYHQKNNHLSTSCGAVCRIMSAGYLSRVFHNGCSVTSYVNKFLWISYSSFSLLWLRSTIRM